jgi:subtilisin family serine protease
MTDASVPYPAWTKESAVLRLRDAIGLPGEADAATITGSGDGAGVTVAVIDSGVDADHPDLEGCVEVERGVAVAVDGDLVKLDTGPHGDVFGHGTACAGVIHSLAPAARIISVRVLDAELGGRVAGFHAGLSWALEQEVDVVNLSLGSRKRDWALAFHDLCDQAYFQGCAVVTAASNSQRISYPSLYSSVFSVACTTTTDPERYHVNPEPPTEFLARGIDVPVLWADGATSTGTGNSYATPHIAGLIARVLGKWPGLRPFQLKALLWAAAANVRESSDPDVAGRLTRARARSTMAGRQTSIRTAQLARGTLAGSW